MALDQNLYKYTQDVIDRFWRKIIFPEDIENDCWETTIASEKDGYKKFSVKYLRIVSHRFSFMIHNHDVDITGKMIRHTCHNRGCVNPKHLIPGTHLDNMNDMKNANRQLYGEKNQAATHKESEIILLLDTVNNDKFNNVEELQDKFNMSRNVFWRIINGTLWKHITKNYDLEKLKKIIFSKNQLHSKEVIIEMLDLIKSNKFKNTKEILDKFSYTLSPFYKIINGFSHKEITKNYDLKLLKDNMIKKDISHKHFTDDEIKDIIERRKNRETLNSIGNKYNVSRVTIGNIIKNKIYKDIGF